jgi:hypothetical protein
MYVGLGKLLEAGEGISDAVDGEVAGVEAEPTATLVSAVEAEAEPHEQVAGDCKSGTSPGGRSML